MKLKFSKSSGRRVSDIKPSTLSDNQPSRAWASVQSIQQPKKDKENLFMKQIKAALSQIRSYPPSSQHPLGFYLEQSAIQDWLPFPLMKMLRSLHEESIVKRKESLLLKWCHLLEALINKDS